MSGRPYTVEALEHPERRKVASYAELGPAIVRAAEIAALLEPGTIPGGRWKAHASNTVNGAKAGRSVAGIAVADRRTHTRRLILTPAAVWPDGYPASWARPLLVAGGVRQDIEVHALVDGEILQQGSLSLAEELAEHLVRR